MTLYLSPSFDSDLIAALNQLGGKSFAKLAKESLRMMVRPGYKSSHLKKIKKQLDASKCPSKTGCVRIHLEFGLKGDEDIRIVLLNAKDRKRSSLVKQAIRFGIGPAFCVGCCLRSNEKLCSEYFESGMFFLANVPRFVDTRSKPTEKASSNKKVVEEKVSNKPILPSVSNFNQNQAPVFPSSEFKPLDTADDDDILNMLDNM